MKNVAKKFIMMTLTVTMLSFFSVSVKAACTETEVVTDTNINMLTEEAVLLDSSTFVIKVDGSVVYDDDVQNNSTRLSDVVTGSMNY